MKEYQSLSHTRWDCKYHVVFIPKRRKKQIFGVLRRQLGEIFHELARHKESKIVEGHLMGDHVHVCLSIPPKYAVANVVGYIKGKSAIQMPGRLVADSAISPAKTFGHAVTSSPRWAWRKTWSEPISATKRKRTSGTSR